jgi:putative DNA primase/helicase
MTAEDIAKVLGGRRAGASWLARCPAHNEREPGLSIRQAEDDTVLVRRHAGCEQARVITALTRRNGYGLHDVDIGLNNQNRRSGRAA